jgi:hypothetical protein
MRRKLSFALFLVLALLLATVPFAMAQEETFGLSAEDFALFSSPNVDADSASFDYSVDVNITGAPDGDVMVALTGSGAFAMDDSGNPVGTLTVTGTADSAGESMPLNAEFRLVDNVIYFNMGDGNWMGQTLDEAMAGASSMVPMPVNPADIISGDIAENPEASEAMGEMMGALSSLEPAEYISITRLGDENNQAHFQVSVDLAGLMSSDAFMQLMTSAGSMSGDESMAGMAPMLAMMFQDASLTWDQFVDLAENRLRQGILDFAMSVNPAMMGASEDASATPVDVAFNLDISNIQYDVPVSVTAPEGATMMSSASE